MGFYDFRCAVSGISLRGADAVLVVLEPDGDQYRPVTLGVTGCYDRLGSIETGKTANVVVTDGDILEPRTNIKYLFINGRMLPLTSRHTELFESFKDRK